MSPEYNGDYLPGFLQCKKIAAHAIKGGNITAEIHNVENLPKEDGFILYPNHQGLFDTLMFFYSSPRPLAFVIKKEARDVILLKQVTVKLIYLEPMYYDEYKTMKTNEIADEVKRRIEEAIAQFYEIKR